MKKTYSLTFPQQSIYLTEQFYKNTNVNNICGTAIVEEKLDFDLLKKAINIVIQYNDSFRIRLIKEETDVKQLISEYQNVDIDIVENVNYNNIFTENNCQASLCSKIIITTLKWNSSTINFLFKTLKIC